MRKKDKRNMQTLSDVAGFSVATLEQISIKIVEVVFE